MRASTAYFAGAGTVIVAIAAGLGGGVLMADIMNPHGTREVSRLEQRQAPQQAQPSPAPSHVDVAAKGAQTEAPYLTATEQAATTPAVVSPAPSSSPEPRNEVNSNANSNTSPPPARAATREQGPAENAYAKARDADVKRADEKRPDDKRKADRAERRAQWAARRQQQREREQREVDAQMDQDAEPGRNIVIRRENPGRDDYDRPMRMDFPRFIFGQD
jgi:hypothetical protein